jgi:hypothetical protein
VYQQKFRVPLSHNPTDNSRARSRLRAKLAIVLGASLTIFRTQTSVRIDFRSCVSTENPPFCFQNTDLNFGMFQVVCINRNCTTFSRQQQSSTTASFPLRQPSALLTEVTLLRMTAALLHPAFRSRSEFLHFHSFYSLNEFYNYNRT